MAKRISLVTFLVALLTIPAFAFAASEFSPQQATVGEDNTVTIPLDISNDEGLMAIDIPLKYSDGVVLKEVIFNDTRTEYFDLKVANINAENNEVVIGLVNQVSATYREPLAAGEGTVAKLVFEVVDPTVTDVTLESFVMQQPHHKLMYVYNRRSEGSLAHDKEEPRFDPMTISLSGAPGGVPASFSLSQNYPNPFNPSTEISFSLPAAGYAELSVFNMLGQKVATLVDGNMTAGEHVVTWNGQNESGAQVASGVYFYRLATGVQTETKKMMLLK